MFIALTFGDPEKKVTARGFINLIWSEEVELIYLLSSSRFNLNIWKNPQNLNISLLRGKIS